MFKSIEDKRMVLTYFGVNIDDLTVSLIGIVNQIKSNKDTKRVIKKMPVLIAECFQNLIRHGAHDDRISETSKECFQVTFDDQSIIMSSVNIIKNNNISTLEQQLKKVNDFNQEELKIFRKEVLFDGHFSDKGGAGLGLIEMTYRSGNKLNYKFVRINDEYSQFFMSLTIGEITENEFSIEIFEAEYNAFIAKDVLLLYKGDIAWETASYIIDMLHENFASETHISDQGLKEITVMIELIQNAAKHSVALNGVKKGVFAVFSKNNKRELYCGNFISPENAEIVKKGFEFFKNAALPELNERFRIKLLTEELDEYGNAGLGLLDIARLTNNNVNYLIQEEPNEQLYVSFNVQLN